MTDNGDESMKKEIKNSEFQFARPIITNMKYELNKEYDPSIETSYKFNIKSNVNKAGENRAIVEVTWFTSKKDGSQNPKFEIEVCMASCFSWDENVSNQTVEELLKHNAVALLLGYIRPVVSVVTSNSVETLDIPFVNLKS